MSNVEPTPQEDKGILYKGKYYKTLDEINQVMQAESGQKVVWNQPGQGPTPGTRYPTPSGETKPVLALSTPKTDTSIEQQRLDYRATKDAYEQWAKKADDGIVQPNVWIGGQTPVVNINKVGMWSKGAGAGTGSMSWQLQFVDTPTNELVGRMAADATGLIRYPFAYLRENAGKPIYNGARWIGDRVFPEITEDALGYAVTRGEVLGQWFYDQAFKPIIRDVASIMMMPIEIIENVVMTGIFNPILESNIDEFNTPNAVEKSQATWKERLTGILSNTTYAQYALERWRTRGFEGGEGQFASSPGGEGFFPSGRVTTKKNQVEDYLRPKLYGQTATIGRVAASPLVEWGVIQAGDDVHSLISGIVDAGFQIYGDPASWVSIADYYKGLGVVAELPTAPATTRQLEKLARKGIIFDPELWQDTTKARDLINQVEGLTDDAIDLLQPKQGIVYSGDRQQPGLVKTNFLDIDDPAHPRNHGNLLGAGLYVTDAPYVATSYTPMSSIIGLTEEQAARIGTGTKEIPLGATEEGAARVYKFEFTPEMNIVDAELPYAQVAANTNYSIETFYNDFHYGRDNAQRLFDELRARGLPLSNEDTAQAIDQFFATGKFETLDQYKTQRGETNLIDFRSTESSPEELSSIGIIPDMFNPYLATNRRPFLKRWDEYFPQLKQQFADVIADGFRRADGPNSLLYANGGAHLDAIKTQLNQTITKLFDNWNYSRQLPGDANLAQTQAIKAQLDELLTSMYGDNLDEILAQDPSLLELGGTYFVSTTSGRLGQARKYPGYLVSDRRQLEVQARNADKLGELAVRYNSEGFGFANLIENVYNLNATNMKQPIVIQEYGDVSNMTNVRLAIAQKGHIRANFQLLFDEIAGVKIPVRQTIITKSPNPDPSIVNDWFAAKGVDAFKYDGGARIGGYGRHNAYNIFRPSKMTILDQTTGRAIPTNQAAELFDEADRLKNYADDLAQARGFQSSAGLVEAGSHVSAAPTQWEVYKNGGSWKNLSLYLASEKNAFKIWSTVLKRRSPELATLLSKATSPEEVTRLMDIAVYNPDPLNYMRQLPGWSGNLVSEAGYRLKQAVSKQSNIFATLPRTPFVALDDLDEGARHVDDLMQLFRMPFEDRTRIMNNFLDIASQADPQVRKQQLFAFAREWEKDVIQNRLKPLVKKMEKPGKIAKKLNIPINADAANDLQEFINRGTRWAREDLDQLKVYVGDDMMNAVPLPYLDGDGTGPALIADLFNSNMYLADPDDIDKFVKLFKPWSDVLYSLRRFPGLYEAGKAKDFLRQRALNAQALWKANVLFGLRYTARVVPDEMMRTTMSGQFRGPFSYVSEIIGGRLNKDIYGRMMPRVNEANQIAADIVTVRRLGDELDVALRAGDDILASRLQKALQEYDTEEILTARQAEIEAILNEDGVSVLDAMIGKKPGLAYETVARETTPREVLARMQRIVDRTTDPREWERAIADEIVGLSTEPDVREVAAAMLVGNDPSFSRVARWLHNGKGRVYFEKYYKGVDKIPGYQWDNIGEAQKRVELLRDMITRVTGGNRDAIQTIVDQTFKSEDGTVLRLGARTSEGPRATRQFRQYLRNGKLGSTEPALFADTRAPQKAAYMQAVTIGEEKKMRDLFGKWMQYTYGVTSDKLARVPLFNSLKWNKIADMMPMLSKPAARELAETVLESDLPKGLKARIAANIGSAGAGELDLKTLQDFAAKWALDDYVDLVFDASKKSNFGRQHSFLFAFFDAYRETAATMLKLGLNPQNIHKVDMARRGLESFRVGGPGESMLFGERDANGDGKQEGFFYTDPGTGKQVLAVPLLGALATMWSDVPFNMAIPVEGLTMQSNVIPGVGPVVGLTYSMFGPQGEDWAWLNKLIFPYGEPGDRTITDYFTPMWARRIVQGQLADNQVGEALRGLLGDPQQNEVFKYMHLRAMQNFAATRGYESGEAGINQLAKESYDAALKLWTMRGLAQLFLPAAPITQYYAETNKGLTPLGRLLDDIRNTENEVLKGGGTIADAQEALVNKWGDFIVPYLASLSQSTRAGSEPSTEFESFRANNKYLFEKYPAAAGLFFEKTGNYDFEAYDLQRRMNEREYLSPTEMAKSIDGLMGGILYRRYENNLPVEYRNTPLGRAILSQKAAEIRKSNPYWNPSLYAAEREQEIARQVTEVIDASTDPQLADQPVMGTLRSYLTYRDGVIGAIRARNPKLAPDGWKTNNGGVLEREVLFQHGQKLATENPTFRNLWDNLLSREFERLTPEKLDSITRTIQTPQEVTTGG